MYSLVRTQKNIPRNLKRTDTQTLECQDTAAAEKKYFLACSTLTNAGFQLHTAVPRKRTVLQNVPHLTVFESTWTAEYKHTQGA